MKNTYLNLKSVILAAGITSFFSYCLQAQTTVSWNGYTSGAIGTNFNSGTAPNNMTAVVTRNAVTLNDGTPKYTAGVTGPPCYIQGLALNAGRFSSYTAATNSHYTVTMTFNPGNVGGINGTCNSATFDLRDINSEESFKSFLDVVEISAMRADGTAVPVSSITTTLASNVRRQDVGSIVKLVGHSNTSETVGSYASGTNCGDTRVIVNPGANTPLRSITIKYRPGYGTSSSNAYYDSGTQPAVQYVSISNITLNSVGSCPDPLPVELSSFTGEAEGRSNLLQWKTATEKNNSHFELERSTNGEEWEKISTVNGAGTTLHQQFYRYYDSNFEHAVNYYRLRQVDYDGAERLSDIVAIDNSTRTKTLEKIVNTMGQKIDESYKGMKIYIYTDGTIIKKMD